MSTVVAIVKSIIGQVVAVSPEGIRRVLIEGDRLLAGEQLDTGAGGAVTLELADGRTLDLGRDTQWSADAPDSSTDLSQATAQAAPSVEELQQAIAAGVDPTTELEATAAGPAAAGGGSVGGGHSFVLLEETAGAVDPSIGFPTGPIGFAAGQGVEEVGGLDTSGNTTTNAPIVTGLTLSATPTITEAGGVIVYTATVGQPPLSNLTVTLSNGAVIVIPAGQTTGTVNVNIPANDTPYVDGGQISATITGTTGGNGLIVTPSTTPAVTEVTDTIDTTTATLTATPSVTEGGVITYTVTLTNPAQTPVTVTLSNGQTVTIEAGKSSGSVDFQTPANDVYNNGSTVSTTITTATGGNFENLVPNPTPAQTVINDSVDTTTATLTATPSVTEGGVITYTVTLTNPAQTPVTVTLSNGQTVTIEAGKSSGSVDFQTPANDVFVNGSTVSTTITGTTGGNFENLQPNPTPAETQVQDSIDTVTVSIEGGGAVLENQAPEFTIKVSQKLDHDLTVTLSNNQTVTIKAGETSVVYTGAVQGDDVYKDGAPVTLGITDATVAGKTFENLEIGGPATVQVNDTESEVVAKLTATPSVNEGGDIVYTITLTNAQGLPVNNHGPLTFTLSDNTVITIAANANSGTVTVKAPDNLYVGANPDVTVSIKDVSGAAVDTFEKLSLDKTPVSTQVTDEPGTPGNPGNPGDTNQGDKFTVSIESNGDVTEAQDATFTIRISEKLDQDLTVYMKDGTAVVIHKGDVTATYTHAKQGDDVYKDSGKITAEIDRVETQDGKSFENLEVNGKAEAQVSDTESEVVAKLTATPSVTEGGDIVYTITLTNAQGLPVNNHGPLTFTLSDNTVITIAANANSGTVTVKAPDNLYVGANPDVTVSIKDVSGAAVDTFEKLSLDKTPVSTQVTDEPGTPGNPGNPGDTNEGDKFTVSIESNGDVTEAQDATFTIRISEKLDQDLTVYMKDGTAVVIHKGDVTATYTHAKQGDDVYKDSGKITAEIDRVETQNGKSFENLEVNGKAEAQVSDTESEVVAKLTATPSVTEGGDIVYTITLTNAQGLPVNNHGPLTFTLSDNTVITIAANANSGTVTVKAPDNLFVGTNPDVTVSIKDVSGAAVDTFEKLSLDKTPVSTSVSDEPAGQGDKFTVSITSNGDVTEAQDATFTIRISEKLDQDLTVYMKDGTAVVIHKGDVTATYTHAKQGDDVYKDSGKITAEIDRVEAQNGKSFENLEVNGKAEAQVSDTESEVVAKLTATPSVTEGGDIVYTITLTNAQGLPVNNHGPLTFTLSDNTVITIAANANSGTVTVKAPDNLYVGANPDVTVSIKDVSGAAVDTFEKLSLDKTPVSTQVTDEPGTPGNPGNPGDTNQGDKFTVSIESNGDVTEAQDATFTIRISEKLDQDLTVYMKDGTAVVIHKGDVTATYTHAKQGDDVYKDSGKITAEIDRVETQDGKSFENLEVNGKAEAQVSDTESEVVAKLTATPSVTEGGDIVYTITLTNAQGLPVNNHGPLTFTLSDNTVITIAANANSGTVTVKAPDNLYVGANPDVTVSIKDVSGAAVDTFEKLSLDKTPVSTQVTDEPGTPGNPGNPGDTNQGDKFTVSIESNGDVTEAQDATFTIRISEKLDQDLTVYMKDGTAVVIHKGDVTATYTHAKQGDDVYKDSGKITAEIDRVETQNGKSFENLEVNGKAEAQVSDTESEVVAKLTATPSVTEGGDIVYTITLTNAQGLPVNNHGPLTFTLSDNTVITIAANANSGTVTVKAPDNLYVGANPDVTVSIKDVSGAAVDTFEKLSLDKTPVSTQVTDEPGTPGNPGNPGDTNQGDKFTVSIESNGDVTEAQDATFTIRISEKLDQDLTVYMKDGTAVVIHKGDVTATYTHAKQGDDVYKDSGKITAEIDRAETQDGKSFENLEVNGKAEAAVSDTESEVVAKLTATPSVTEGGDIVYTITLTNAQGLPVNNHGPLTFTLSDNTVITIAANANSGTVTVKAPDNLFVGTNPDVTVSIKDVSGAAVDTFEKLSLDKTPVSTQVTDEPGTPGNPGNPGDTNQGDKFTVSIESNGDVTEAQDATFTIRISEKLDQDLTVYMKDGTAVVIHKGDVTATYTHAKQGDDVYKDSGKITAEIDRVETQNGKSFENLEVNGKAEAAVSDTESEVVAKLTATPSVTEGGDIVYTITLTNAQGLPVNNHGPLTFTLSDNTVITIAANANSGTVTVKAPDNLYVGANPDVTVSIKDVSGAAVDTFEKLSLDKTPVSTQVTDEPGTPGNPGNPGDTNEGDKFTVSIESNGDVTEAQDATFTIRISEKLDQDLTVYMKDGTAVVIHKGDVTATYTHAKQGDDVYKDSGKITAEIDRVETQNGKSFENLEVNGKAEAQVSDTESEVVAKLTATPSVTEGGDIVYTITLTNAQGLPVNNHGPLTFTLSDNTVITIAANANSGTVTVKAPDNLFVGTNPDVTVSIKDVSGSAVDTFEKLSLDKTPVSTQVTDEPGTPGNPGNPGDTNQGDKFTVSIESNGDVTEAQDATFTIRISEKLDQDLTVYMKDGTAVVIHKGDVTATYTHAKQGDDVYKDSGKITAEIDRVETQDGKSFENLEVNGKAEAQVSDTESEVVAKLTATPSVTEGGDIVYTITLTNAQGLPVNNHGPLTFTLSDNTVITIAANANSGTVSVKAPDNLFVGTNPDVTVSIKDVSGAAVDTFEKLSLDKTPVSTSVTDEPAGQGDKFTVSITSNGDVTEAQDATFTIRISEKLDQDLTVYMKDGTAVVIHKGDVTATYTHAKQGDDVYKDSGKITAEIDRVETQNGKSFENLEVNGKAEAAVSDTESEVVAKLTATPSVTEGGDIVYTITLTNAQGLPVNNHGPLTFTLSDNTVITIAANANSGTVTVKAPDNLFVGANPDVTVSIKDVSGAAVDTFEKLSLDKTPVNTSVTDEPAGQGDKFTVSITSNGDVTEAQDATFTIRISEKLDQDLTVYMKDGTAVVIHKGDVTATYTHAKQGDDVYKDSGKITAEIDRVETQNGKSFENLEVNGKAEAQVSDTESEVVAKLTATPSVTEGGDIVYTITLTNAQGLPVNNHGPLTFTLSDNTVITIAANANSGTVTVKAPDNLFVGTNPDVTVSIKDVSGAAVDTFEKLSLDKTPVSTSVSDEPAGQGDKFTVSITSNGDVTEAQDATFTIRISEKLDQDLTVYMKDGTAVVIHKGDVTATYTHAKQGDDVYKDSGKITAEIDRVETQNGKSFENLTVNGKAEAAVSDTESEVVAKLTATPSVTEGGDIVYTITLTNAQGLPINNHGPLTFTLSDNTVITIAANSNSGTVTVKAPDNLFVGTNPDVTVSIKDVSGTAVDTFEKLSLDKTSVSTSVTDEPAGQGDKFTVSITSNGDVTEAQDATFTIRISEKLDQDLTVYMKDGTAVVIHKGDVTATYTHAKQGDDVYKDSGKITAEIDRVEAQNGKSFENLTVNGKAEAAVTDTESEVVAKLTATPSVTEGGDIVYTITLTNAQGLPVNNHGPLTFTLSDNTVITIAANANSGTVTVKAPDNLYVGTNPNVTVAIKDVSGTAVDTFEKLSLDKTPVSTSVTDEPAGQGDKFTVSITSNGDVTEAQDATFTIRISEKLDQDLTVYMKDGTAVVIHKGDVTATYTHAKQGDDVYKDSGKITAEIDRVETQNGKSFENLTVNGKAEAAVSDTESEVVAKLTATPSVTEGGDIVYTITLTNAQGLPINNHGPLTFTLSDNTVITIAANANSGTVTVKAPDNLYVGTNPNVTVAIKDVSGSSVSTFEKLTLDKTPVSTSVTDEPAGQGDKFTVSITSNGDVTEAQDATFTIRISEKLDQNLTVYMKDGTAVVIQKGDLTATYTHAKQGDDVYKDSGKITAEIDRVETQNGKSFENLTVNGKAEAAVSDTESEVVAKLTATPSVTEGGDIVYTITLTNAQGLPINNHGPLTFTLSDNTVITIPQNGKTGTVTVKAPDNSVVGTNPDVTVSIKDVSGAAVNTFEKLTLDKTPVSTSVIDNDHMPVSTGGAVTGSEDTTYVFKWGDFNVTDADGNTGLSVTITKLPVAGSLKLDNGTTLVDVKEGQTISQADIAAGKLKFVPQANESGVDGYGGNGVGNKQADYAQINYKPNDGTNIGSEVTMKVDITPVADKPTLNIGNNNVGSIGLLKETWNSLSGLGSNGNGITGDTLKNVFANAGNASKSETVTGVDSVASVTAGSGSKTSGLIYLEAGKTYAFSGTADDSLQIVVGGKNVASGTWGANSGAITGSFTPTTSGYYTLEIYNANQAGPGSLDVNIKVGNGAVTDLNSSNIPMYPSVKDLNNAGVTVSDLHGNNGQGYYDGYKLNEGSENGAPVKLVGISTNLTDTDGSETLSIKLGGIPAGSVLADNAGHTITVGKDAVDVTGWNLGSLTIKPPAYYQGQFDVKVTSTSTESVGGSTATSEGSIKVTVYPQTYTTSNLSSDSDNITGTDGNDIVVSDVAGLHVVPGQNYNLAFIVDTSGSMGSAGVDAAKKSLESVFNTLAASVKGDASGKVNILLVDFATQVKSSVSVTLNDAGLQQLLNALNMLRSDGGTNYEDAFKTTANWFQNLKDAGNTGSNQTFFITDGKPTYYQTGENPNPTLGTSGISLDTFLASINYKPGMAYSDYIDSSRTNYVSIDNAGNLQVQYNRNGWKYGVSGELHAEGNGTYELSSRGGLGYDTNSATQSNSLDSFKLLSGLSTVEAIGLNNGVNANDLKPFDSDGKPQTNIDPSKLAEAILGHTEVTKPGDDTVNGGDGNDIIFGDVLTFDGIPSTGVDAIQAFVAGKLGVTAGDVDARAMHKYITEHYSEFDVSRSNDGSDKLYGGNGDDIIFGQGGDDYIDGGKGNDILIGGTGNDTLLGGEGNDILIGGKGDDILIGGSGADTFVWKAGDLGKDVIKDFNVKEGDRLDLSDLLQGEKASTIDNFLKITTVGGESTLQVSTEGKLNAAGGLANADVTIKLEGVNWSNTTINSLISGADPTIKIDHN